MGAQGPEFRPRSAAWGVCWEISFAFNVCLPQVSMSGDRLLVLGGEADMREVAGVNYAHDGNFVVQGTLRVSTDV